MARKPSWERLAVTATERMSEKVETPSEYIEIPDLLLDEVLQSLSPMPWVRKVPTADEKAVIERHRHQTSDMSRKLIEALIEYLEEGAEGPDWSVGIYGNNWGQLAYELKLLLDGKLVCPV